MRLLPFVRNDTPFDTDFFKPFTKALAPNSELALPLAFV